MWHALSMVAAAYLTVGAVFAAIVVTVVGWDHASDLARGPFGVAIACASFVVGWPYHVYQIRRVAGTKRPTNVTPFRRRRP